MATTFEALDELLDDALELPGIPGRDGKKRQYRIPSPSSLDGLRIQAITNLASRAMQGGEALDTSLLDDDKELDLIQLCLGPADTELQADGVDWAWRRHAGLTAFFWITADADTARNYWLAAGDPSRIAPENRETRRKTAKKAGSAGASSTKRRASTSGTSARPATGSARKAART